MVVTDWQTNLFYFPFIISDMKFEEIIFLVTLEINTLYEPYKMYNIIFLSLYLKYLTRQKCWMRQITVISENKQNKPGAKNLRMFINNLYFILFKCFIFTLFGQKMVQTIDRFLYGTFWKIFGKLTLRVFINTNQ